MDKHNNGMLEMIRDISKIKILYTYINNIDNLDSDTFKQKMDDIDADLITELIEDEHLTDLIVYIKKNKINEESINILISNAYSLLEDIEAYNEQVETHNNIYIEEALNQINLQKVKKSKLIYHRTLKRNQASYDKSHQSITSVAYGGTNHSLTESTLLNKINYKIVQVLKYYNPFFHWSDNNNSEIVRCLFKRKIDIVPKGIINYITDIVDNLNDIYIDIQDLNLESFMYIGQGSRFRCKINSHPFMSSYINDIDDTFVLENYKEGGYIWLEDTENKDIYILQNPKKDHLQTIINDIYHMIGEPSKDKYIKLIKKTMNIYPYLFYTSDIRVLSEHKVFNYFFRSSRISEETDNVVVIQQAGHGLCWLCCILNSIYISKLDEMFYKGNVKENLKDTNKHYSVLEFIKRYDISKTIPFSERIRRIISNKNKPLLTSYGSNPEKHIEYLLTRDGINNLANNTKRILHVPNFDQYLPFVCTRTHCVCVYDNKIYDSVSAFSYEFSDFSKEQKIIVYTRDTFEPILYYTKDKMGI